jgi:hypothetical protein
MGPGTGLGKTKPISRLRIADGATSPRCPASGNKANSYSDADPAIGVPGRPGRRIRPRCKSRVFQALWYWDKKVVKIHNKILGKARRTVKIAV